MNDNTSNSTNVTEAENASGNKSSDETEAIQASSGDSVQGQPQTQPETAPEATPAIDAQAQTKAQDTITEQDAASANQKAYAQYQVLANTVLESAENATRATKAAIDATREMRQTTSTVMDLGASSYKRNQILLAAGGGLMLVSLIFFTIMGVRMIRGINELDAMVLAVGKRTIELNTGLESLSNFQQSMQDIMGKQMELKKSQAQLEARIETSLKQSESVAQKVPQETAKQVAASSNTLIKQVQDINNRLQSQAGAVKNLGNDIKSLQSANADVGNLKRDVQALITLQKERYLEALQKTNQSQDRERAVQYPRRDNKPSELMPRQQ